MQHLPIAAPLAKHCHVSYGNLRSLHWRACQPHSPDNAGMARGAAQGAQDYCPAPSLTHRPVADPPVMYSLTRRADRAPPEMRDT